MTHSLLLYGHNAELQRIRGLVLKTGGHEVLTSTHLGDVVELMENGYIDLLILCHTLHEDECEIALEQMSLIGSYTKALVLVVGVQNLRESLYANFDSQTGPENLLATVDNLMFGQDRGLLST